MLFMNLNVVAQVAAVTHGLQMLAPGTARVVAKVRGRERNDSLRPLCRMPVKFYAAPWPSCCFMQATFPNAFTLRNTVRVFSSLTNLAANRFPVLWIIPSVYWHLYVIFEQQYLRVARNANRVFHFLPSIFRGVSVLHGG